MRRFLVSVFLLMAIIGFTTGCNDDDCCSLDPDSPLVGTWILFERGYSPGAGYIVEPVETEPAQIIELQADEDFSSNIQGLEEFRYFRILEDDQGQILALFKHQTRGDLDVDQLEHSYLIELQEDGSVRLYFRYCFEGCHLGLRKID